MGILLTLILGALAGAIASVIMKSTNGIAMDIILGIVGAFVGSFIMNAFGASGTNGFNVYSLLVAVLGAVIVIGLGRTLTRRAI